MTIWKDQWVLRRINGRWDFCDKVCLSVVPTSVQEEKVGVAPRDGFMAIEFFWEALLFGRRRISGTQMPSAQKNAYAKVVYFGGVGHPDVFAASWSIIH